MVLTVDILASFLTLMAAVSVCRGGTDFALGVIRCGILSGVNPVGRIYVTNPGASTASVSITTPRRSPGAGGISGSLNVPAGGSAYYEMDESHQLSGSGIEDKGIRVTSDEEVVVQVLNAGYLAADGFRVPPGDQLGKLYIAVTHKYLGSSSYQGPYEIGIVALYDVTTITVELHGPQPLSLTFDGASYSSGSVVSFTLDSYEAAQFQCTYGNGGDLSGTTIVADKPVFVTSGAAFSSVGMLEWPDHLVTVLPPVEQLGRKYVIQPVVGRTTGDVLSVVGVCADTTYSITEADGTSIGVVDQPLSRSQLAMHTLSSGVSHVLEASCPVLVAQLAMCFQGEIHDDTDPFLLAVPTVDAPPSAHYAFSSMTSLSGGEYTNTLALVILTAARGGVLLDSVPLSPTPTWTEIGELSASQVPVVVGTHTLEHSGGVRFVAWLYGQRNRETYALELSPYPGTFAFTPWATSFDDVGRDLTTLHPTTEPSEVSTEAALISASPVGNEVATDKYVLSAPGRVVHDPGALRTCITARNRLECAVQCAKIAAWCLAFDYNQAATRCCLLDGASYGTAPETGTSIWISL